MGNHKRSEKNKTIYLNIYKCFKSTHCISVCERVCLCVCINMVFFANAHCGWPRPRIARALSSCWQNSVNAKSHLNMHEARPQLNFPSSLSPNSPSRPPLSCICTLHRSLSISLSLSLSLPSLPLLGTLSPSWPIMRRKSQLKLHCAAANSCAIAPLCTVGRVACGMWHVACVCLPSATYIMVTVANCEWQRNGWMTKAMEVVQTRWEGEGGRRGKEGEGSTEHENKFIKAFIKFDTCCHISCYTYCAPNMFNPPVTPTPTPTPPPSAHGSE